MIKKYALICLLCTLALLIFSYGYSQGFQVAATDPSDKLNQSPGNTQLTEPKTDPQASGDHPSAPAGEEANEPATPPPPPPPPPPPTGADAQVSDGEETSPYQVEVIIAEQKVRVWEGQNLIKELVASTGIDDSTPLGEFKIEHRGNWFFSEKYQQGAIWWVAFTKNGKYLFHSLPMDKDRQVIEEEALKLGTPASHGCVRLAIEDAKWFYDTVPAGTRVYIHN